MMLLGPPAGALALGGDARRNAARIAVGQGLFGGARRGQQPSLSLARQTRRRLRDGVVRMRDAVAIVVRGLRVLLRGLLLLLVVVVVIAVVVVVV
jgi:hypothetical protein